MRSAMQYRWPAFATFALFLGCSRVEQEPFASVGRVVGTDVGSADVAVTPSGAAVVTWLDSAGDAVPCSLRWALQPKSAALDSTALSGKVVVAGERLFANWADFPHVVALSDTSWIVTYLERVGEGKYDYGVRFTATTDSGATWSEPRWLHDHVGPGEHGFVSLVREDERTARAVWLDGRELRGEAHGSEGAMTLRMRSVTVDGSLGPERLLDERVCDCCQTDIARSGDGAWLVAYRDRSEDEIRDIKVLRVQDDSLATVFDSQDRFQFEGCPVNGPALASDGARVVLAWFAPSLSGGGALRVAASQDSGATFALTQTLDDDAPAGRVEIVFRGNLGRAHVIWLGEADLRSVWRCASLGLPPGSREWRDVELYVLAPTTAGRESGFPRAGLDREGAWIVHAGDEAAPGIVLRRASW